MHVGGRVDGHTTPRGQVEATRHTVAGHRSGSTGCYRRAKGRVVVALEPRRHRSPGSTACTLSLRGPFPPHVITSRKASGGKDAGNGLHRARGNRWAVRSHGRCASRAGRTLPRPPEVRSPVLPTDGIHPGAILRAHRAIIRYRGSNDLPRFPHRIALELARRALAFTHGVVAITRYRVFVFAFATTLAPGARDLPLLRLLGKRVIVVASNGSESRAPYCCGAQQPLMPGEEPDPDSLADQSRRKRALLRRIERWADVVVGAPLGSSPCSRVPSSTTSA